MNLSTILACSALAVLVCACGASSDDASPSSFPHSTQKGGGASGSGGTGGTGSTNPIDGKQDDPGATGAEQCGNGLDDDADGAVDEDCACTPAKAQPCYGGQAKLAGVGACAMGAQTCESEGSGEFTSGRWGDCEGFKPPAEEQCNGIDDDCDGQTDEGLTQACSSACGSGTQECVGGQWGPCGGAPDPKPEECNGLDDDCDGQVDEGLKQPCDAGCGQGEQTCSNGAWSSCSAVVVEQAVDINGDCVWASCTGATPYPVGCAIDFVGGDSRGCVAYVPGQSKVYFQEGNVCSAGHLSGKLLCSSCPGGPLNASNCPINKPNPIYVTSAGDCPD